MKKVLVSVILLFSCISFSFSQTDKRIEEIRKIYQEVNKNVIECDENGDISTTFLTEMIVNKNDGSYPAVGIYKTTVKFYYTFGDREKNPYPDRLLKIMVTINRSDRTELSEYLFDVKGKLIFYFEKKDEFEKRIYFNLEKPIKILQGEKTLPVNPKQEAEAVKAILREKSKLVKIFLTSIQF